jgi:iron complex outermembrane receptor protein
MHQYKKNTLARCIGIAVATVLLPTPAVAQLEEIVVTANRRAENLQDVPVAVSALSENAIEKAGIRDITDIATRVPGLTFASFSAGQNVVALRGASSNDDGAGTDNSVAVFIDDIYLGRASNINPELFDLQGIEVLRGPQGTLYGKNTIGGAIVIKSTRPNTEEFEGKLKLGIGNYSRQEASLLLTGPLSDQWAGKISITHRSRDGWVNNVYLNKKQKDDNAQGVRGQLLFSGDQFEALLSADASTLDVEDMGRIPVNTGDPLDPGFWAANVPGSWAELCAGKGPKCSAGPVDGFTEKDAWGVSAKLTWEFESGDFTSITAYRENEVNWSMDSTGTPQNGFSAGTDLFDFVDDRILDTTEQITQEFRWVASVNDNFNYVAGLWLSHEETDRTECFDNDSTPSDCIPDADDGATDWYRQVNETTSYAAFGQFDWIFAESWILTMGGRYSYDEKEIDNDTIAGDFVVINQTFSNSVSENWSAFTPKVSLAYQPTDNVNIYGTISQGFKSGGFAAAPQGEEFTEPLDQEEALNYEFGIKADVTDNFRLNTAVFFTEYTDLQIQTFGPLNAGASFGTFQTFNAGDAEIFGAEIEATWAITENLTLSGFYGYQDSEFTKTNIPGTAYPDQSGQDMLRTPDEKYNIDMDYIQPLANGSELALNISYRYTSDQRNELEPYAVQPDFKLVDARATWTNSDGDWEVSAWGKNLTNEEYITHIYTIASSLVAVYGDPSMYGLSTTYRF